MSSIKVNWRLEQSGRGGLGERTLSPTASEARSNEDGKTRSGDARTDDGKARPNRSGGCETFLAWPNVDLQGDQGRAFANSQVRYTHHHHAHRSGVLLGKSAR